MITLFNNNFNIINQDIYDSIINNTNLFNLQCPSCHHFSCLIKHGTYIRSIRLANSTISLKILRVFCKECGHTHAILLDDIVPYSQITLEDQVEIIENDDDVDFLNNNTNFSASDLKYIKKQYQLHWMQRLLAYSIQLDFSVSKLCFKYYNRQFMQIKRTVNSLQALPT